MKTSTRVRVLVTGLRARVARLGFVAFVAGVWVFASARGQEIRLGEGPVHGTQRQYVSLATDAVGVRAGVPEWVELRFRVERGFHINSHRPHDELLIPTELEASTDLKVKVVGQSYPEGVPLRLDVGAGEVLSTYQGEFRVRVEIVAATGDAVLAGSLQYQACDARSCFPPRSLPVRVALAAR